MRKCTFFTVLIILFVVCFAGCENLSLGLQPSQNETSVGSSEGSIYESFVYDIFNDGIIMETEADFWNGTYYYKEGLDKRSCTVLDKNYTGNYIKSIINNNMSYSTDIYRDEINNLTFGLNSQTGNVVNINFMNEDFISREPTLPEINNPYNNAIVIATKIASQYVDNISDYETDVDEWSSLEYEVNGKNYRMTFYGVKFYKTINDYVTSDFIYIQTTSKGSIAIISLGDIGIFEGVHLNIDTEMVNKSLSSKIDSTYKQSQFEVSKMDVKSQELAITPEGDICVCSNVIISGSGDSNMETQTGIKIITIVKKGSK